MPVPYIENLHSIKDLTTGLTFACTVKDFSSPFDWKTAIVPTPFGHGGIDAHAGANDWLAPRTVTVTIIHVYTGAETYKVVTNALEAVIGQGNPLELTTQEEDGTVWLWSGLRLSKYDKRRAAGEFARFSEYPLTFIAPDPQQRALYKPGILLLDNGLFLDDTPVWYLDTDPDNFALNVVSPTQHTIFNATGIAPDYAPIVDILGPITGPLTAYFYDANGNQITWGYQGSIAANETLRVDATQQEVTSTLIGPNAYTRFTPPTGTDLWGIVRPGTNNFYLYYTAASSPAAATIGWAPRK